LELFLKDCLLHIFYLTKLYHDKTDYISAIHMLFCVSLFCVPVFADTWKSATATELLLARACPSTSLRKPAW
jgi:hypothetical protein